MEVLNTHVGDYVKIELNNAGYRCMISNNDRIVFGSCFLKNRITSKKKIYSRKWLTYWREKSIIPVYYIYDSRDIVKLKSFTYCFIIGKCITFADLVEQAIKWFNTVFKSPQIMIFELAVTSDIWAKTLWKKLGHYYWDNIYQQLFLQKHFGVSTFWIKYCGLQ